MKNREDFMDNKYAVGDIVKLNAGGPDMSVLDVEKKYPDYKFEGKYRCQWFAGKKLESGVFEEASLLKVDSDEG